MTNTCIHCNKDILTCGCPDECEIAGCHNDISSPNKRFFCKWCATYHCEDHHQVLRSGDYRVVICPQCDSRLNQRRIA